jgi:hypothetical protein
MRTIAEGLDARGVPAARGGTWSAVQVSRLLARLNPSPFEVSAAASGKLHVASAVQTTLG